MLTGKQSARGGSVQNIGSDPVISHHPEDEERTQTSLHTTRNNMANKERAQYGDGGESLTWRRRRGHVVEEEARARYRDDQHSQQRKISRSVWVSSGQAGFTRASIPFPWSRAVLTSSTQPDKISKSCQPALSMTRDALSLHPWQISACKRDDWHRQEYYFYIFYLKKLEWCTIICPESGTSPDIKAAIRESNLHHYTRSANTLLPLHQ